MVSFNEFDYVSDMHYSTTIQCILCANETDIVSPEILPTVEEFLTSSCSEPFLMLAGDMLALQPT